MVFHSTAETLDHAAEVFWKIASDNNTRVADGSGEAYEAAERVVKALYFAVFSDATDQSWRRVRELLAELGPYDGYHGVSGQGIRSYHLGALAEQAEEQLEDAFMSFDRQFVSLVREFRAEYVASLSDKSPEAVGDRLQEMTAQAIGQQMLPLR